MHLLIYGLKLWCQLIPVVPAGSRLHPYSTKEACAVRLFFSFRDIHAIFLFWQEQAAIFFSGMSGLPCNPGQ